MARPRQMTGQPVVTLSSARAFASALRAFRALTPATVPLSQTPPIASGANSRWSASRRSRQGGNFDGVPLLRPEDQVFQAMLDGWRNQQLARNLARSTVEGREASVKAFADYVSAYPWAWSPAMVDEWLGDLRSLGDLKRTTIRSYSEAVRAFCHFATDPLYGWAETCEERFGTHPVQVVHEWNTAVHVQDSESDPRKRAFTKAELHAFFERCDNEVARATGLRPQGLAARVPRRRPVQNCLCLRPSAQRDEDARCR